MGRYWLAGRLGAGGQGVVYEGYGEVGERVAIKVPRYDSAESRARLAKEAAAAQRVASFCTAKVIEAQVDSAPLYIVSEFVPGPSLRRVVAESGSYEKDALRRLAIGVATALTAIHQGGIVHRDLKPDNIIMGPDGPRLIDFGVAREVGPTTSGPIMGTPGYMPPEAFSGRGASEAADLWAWAMVVLFAARGKDVIEARDPATVIGRVMELEPDVCGLPEPLDVLVAAALARDPTKRPAAGEVLLRLLGHGGEALLRRGDDLLERGLTQAGALTGRPEPDLGAIAEELYGELTEAERATAPEVFLRMIDGDELRPVGRDELPESQAVDAMLTVFGAAGLVTRSGATYELATPGLLHAWPRLRDWVAGNREGLPVHRRLAEAAALWNEHGRRPADLLHGSALDRTLQWAATAHKDLTLGRREREFLDEAVSLARKRARRRRLVAAALAVLLVVALGGLGTAEYLRRESSRQREDALARELALRAADLRQSDPQVAKLLSVAGWRLRPELPETRGALYDSLSQTATSVFLDPDYTAATVQNLSQDGRVLVSVDGGTARIWDVAGQRRIGVLSGVSAEVSQAALAPDGHTLALLDHEGVRLWDTRTGRSLGAPIARQGRRSGGGTLNFDSSGRYLAIPWGAKALPEWWDVAKRKQLTAPSGAALNAISRDGRFGYVVKGHDAELWDLRRGKRTPIPPERDKGVINQTTFSDDGKLMMTTELVNSRETSRIRMFELPSGEGVMGQEGGAGPGGGVGPEAGFVFGDAFIANWGGRERLTLQRRSTPDTVFSEAMPAFYVTVYSQAMPAFVGGLRFDLAGRAVRYLDEHGAVHTEDVSMVFDPPISGGSESGNVRLAPSTRVLAAIWEDRVEARDVATGRVLMKLISRSGGGGATAFSPDGRRLALAADNTVHIVDLTGSKAPARLKLEGDREQGTQALAFSPDGRTLAVSRYGEHGRVELWDLEHGSRRAETGTGANNLAFRPDGRLLVTGNPLQLIDPEKGATRPPEQGTGQLAGAFAFSPDGRQVAFSGPGRLTLWDGDVRTRIAEFPAVPGSEVTMLAWSPDGRTIATYEKGLRVRLWDVPSRRPLGVVFDGKQAADGADGGWVAFSADGTKLHTAAPDGTIRVFDVDERHVAATLCVRAGRTLTAGEWSRHLPGIEPFTMCP
ncbi:protein kinase [Nonomuraea angiospora]|uniref:WD40 repeat protein n=1 Tax=Nonomuraea angiospora TaxID=46172 RepID=A0ABR9MK91_9ACTN|nr:WD40 repeat domain-containing serine/threonine-protein kinase [Nonomuraea angiospora]MBE1593345.1 WD40 repeat protein [Nonomuraea angiospora]